MDHGTDHGDLQNLQNLQNLASVRGDLLTQLSTAGVELIHLPRCPEPAATDYPERTLIADVICLEAQLLADFPDPEHRH